MNTVEPIRDMGTVNDIADYLKSQCYRNYVMFVFGIYSGLRISDILRLRVRDVRGKKDVYIREKKTGKEKSFPINPELRPILNEYIKDKADYEYVFLGERRRFSRRSDLCLPRRPHLFSGYEDGKTDARYIKHRLYL